MVAFQRSLFASGAPRVDTEAEIARIGLEHGAWIDVGRGWLTGADSLLDVLVERADWRQGRRWMYDRYVDDPRFSCWYPDRDALPDPALVDVRRALEHRYRVVFPALGLNYYRDGKDSVAFHADRELRVLDDTLVAIVTLGACRPFHVRPRGGGSSIDLSPASGDLLVMGGACQLHYEHAVPKVARAGPRVSATWRWARRSAEGAAESPLPPAAATTRS